MNPLRSQAPRAGYAAIGGAIENGIDRPLNCAVYCCDFGQYQNLGLHYVAILLASWSFGEAMGYCTRALPRARPAP